MRKLKRLWLCRDGQHQDHPVSDSCYVLYVKASPPSKRKRRHGWWSEVEARIFAEDFESSHSIRLSPGDGPVEVEPLRIKKAVKP